MANLDNSQKLDLLWKRTFYQVAETSTSKSAYEETNISPLAIGASGIWSQDHLIPPIPGIVDGVTEFVSIELIKDPTVADGTTWVAVVDPGLGSAPINRLGDFISPAFSPAYEVQVFSDAALTQRIFNSAEITKWVFDYTSGILWFPQLSPILVEDPVDYDVLYLTGYRYVGEKGLKPTFSGDVIEVLGDPSSGNYTGGYVPGFVAGVTTISDAVNQINVALNDFVPMAPPALNEMILQIPGAIKTIADANIILADGAVDSTNITGFKPNPGNVVSKIVGLNVESNFVGPFGDGSRGQLQVRLNNQNVGSADLVPGDNSGVYGKLYINQEARIGTSLVSFYETMIAKAVNINFVPGMNALWLRHTITGDSSYAFVVQDSSNVLPSISNVTVDDTSSAIIDYSSGIPHYGRGTQLYMGATVDNLATDITLDSKNVTFNTVDTKAGPEVWAFPGRFNLPTVLTKAATYTIENVPFEVSDTENTIAHGSSPLRVVARNCNGTTTLDTPYRINYMRGGAGVGMSPISESGVAINNLGTTEAGFELLAQRLLLPNQPTPVWTTTDGVVPAWDSSENLAPYEAAIIGGAIAHTTENYSVNYLPAGPDYSNHAVFQYITFAIQRKNVSQMIIDVDGRYSNMWVKLAGITNQPLSPNGWMDATRLYDGFGVPGREVSAGCAIGSAAFGGSQAVHVTFGYENSSNALNNMILVRFRLIGGDKITGLSFNGV